MSDSCPTCAKKLDAATDPYGEAKPEVGDVTVCFYCGSLFVFETVNPFSYRAVTQQDKVAMEPELLNRLERIQEAVLLKKQ